MYFFKLVSTCIKLSLIAWLAAINNLANAQTAELKTLSFPEFNALLLKYHPVVKQAELLPEQARQELIMVRGAGFDPKLQATWDNKAFDGKEYFNILQTALKIPTWFGAEFKAGYDDASGQFLDPERTVPRQGQTYIGVTVPVGQGLFIDQRRATLRQAQLFRQINEAEKVKMINKIMFEAAKDYWDWYFTYYRFRNLELGYNLASDRYKFVKSRVNIGEEAPIDSVEAAILLQTRFVTYSQGEMEFKNAGITLSNHLWGEDNTPLEIEDNVVPDTSIFSRDKFSPEMYDELLQFAQKMHPEILKLNLKIRQLQVERRLAAENLKPQINLSYNLLSRGLLTMPAFTPEYATNNYKAGIDVSIPLVFRKELGKLQLTKAKIKSTEFERNFASRQIVNEINKFYNELQNIELLMGTQQQLVRNFGTLLNGEYQKFINGESSLFLVNMRESSLIESKIKMVEMQSKYQKSKAGLLWAAGRNSND